MLPSNDERERGLPRLGEVAISRAMLHLIKLSVGTRDVAGLREWQISRAREAPPLRHRTRHMPRRAAEIVSGGSIYWVIQGAVLVRQRVLALTEDRWDDNSACAAIVLDPELVAVETRPVKPFQGWRYLTSEAAPPDLVPDRFIPRSDILPASLMQALRELCLL